MVEATKRYSAGMPIDDLCRVCKETRAHTVVATGADGVVLRVICDYCGSVHNYRHGGPEAPRSSGSSARSSASAHVARAGALPIVSERERTGAVMSVGDGEDLEMLLRRIVREEAGVTPVVPADKWRGGTLVLRPGRPGVQEATMPIEKLFHKVVMIRNKLRVLEQQLNSLEVAEEQKIKLQSYVTGCYGSLTTFNVLFADEEDRFRGSGGDD